MKLKLRILLTATIVLITASCSDNGTDPPEPDPDAVRVAGSYEATTFIIPGDNDIPINVLEIGGLFEVELLLDFSLKGRWLMPENQNFQQSRFDEMFEGTYDVKDDSLQFIDTGILVPDSDFFFEITDSSLELTSGLSTIAPIKVEMKKLIYALGEP